MRVVVVTITLLIGFVTATRAHGQEQPSWIEHVWGEGNGKVRPHDATFDSEGIVVVGAATNETHFGPFLTDDPYQDTTGAFLVSLEPSRTRFDWARTRS